MHKVTAKLLEFGILSSTVLAILYMVRMALGLVLNISWYWGAALACLTGPLLLVAAKFLHARTGVADSVASKPNA